MANDRDELGAIARAFDALNTSLCGREALLHDAEQTIEHNEARYRDLFDANPHPMLVFDTESLDILAANDMAVTGYGFSRSQFLRMTVRHLLPEPVTEGATAVLERMALDDERPVETYHRRRDGSVFAAEVASHRIRFADRRAALVMVTDITLRKQVEAENRRRTESLESLYATARAHSESLSQDEVARLVVSSAVTRFGAVAAWLGRARDRWFHEARGRLPADRTRPADPIRGRPIRRIRPIRPIAPHLRGSANHLRSSRLRCIHALA